MDESRQPRVRIRATLLLLRNAAEQSVLAGYRGSTASAVSVTSSGWVSVVSGPHCAWLGRCMRHHSSARSLFQAFAPGHAASIRSNSRAVCGRWAGSSSRVRCRLELRRQPVRHRSWYDGRGLGRCRTARSHFVLIHSIASTDFKSTNSFQSCILGRRFDTDRRF